MNQERYVDTRHLLVAVDVQNDFIDGSLAVKGGIDVVAPLNTLAHAVRRDLGRVAFTRDWHPAATPHFDTWPVHCVADTDGAAFHPDLQLKEGDVVLNKGMGQTDGYSGIFMSFDIIKYHRWTFFCRALYSSTCTYIAVNSRKFCHWINFYISFYVLPFHLFQAF